MTPGVTPCIMRRGGSLFCVVAPLSPLLHPAVAVSRKVSPDSLFAAPTLGSGPSRQKKLLQSVFEANSEGLTGVPQQEQKLVEACERAFTPPLRSFYRTSPLRAFRRGSSRGEIAKIYHPKLVSSAFSYSSTGELLGHHVFAPASYRVTCIRDSQMESK